MPEPMTDEQVLAGLPKEAPGAYSAYLNVDEDSCNPEQYYLGLAARDLAAALRDKTEPVTCSRCHATVRLGLCDECVEAEQAALQKENAELRVCSICGTPLSRYCPSCKHALES